MIYRFCPGCGAELSKQHGLLPVCLDGKHTFVCFVCENKLHNDPTEPYGQSPKPAADKLLCPNCGADHSIWGGSIKCGKCQKFFPDSWPPGYWPKPDRRAELRAKHRHLPILLLKRDDIEDAQRKAELYNKKYNDAVADINELLEMLEKGAAEHGHEMYVAAGYQRELTDEIGQLKAALEAKEKRKIVMPSADQPIWGVWSLANKRWMLDYYHTDGYWQLLATPDKDKAESWAEDYGPAEIRPIFTISTEDK